jgi:hypothetical protein
MTDQRDRDAVRDLDRRLAGFLGEDRGRAPERAIEGALLHARSHPRRRDALAAVRPDPMDGWAAALGLGRAGAGLGRTVPRLAMVAALGLLLVAAFAVASVGGMFDRPGLVPPDVAPSAAPTDGASPLPSSPAPSPSVAGQPIRIELQHATGGDAVIDIVDASGSLVSAASGTPGDGVSTDGASVVVTQGDIPETIVLTWTDGQCETLDELAIEPDGRTMTLRQPTCQGGDAMGRDLVLELTFDAPVSPSDVTATLETIPE